MKQTDRPIKKEEANEVYRSDPEMSKGKRDRAGRSQATRVAEVVRARKRSTEKTRATLHADIHVVISPGSHPLQPCGRTGHSPVGSRTKRRGQKGARSRKGRHSPANDDPASTSEAECRRARRH